MSPDAAAAPPATAPVNVLLVDDHPASLLALEAVLGDPDRRLVRARSGQEALRRLADDDFAVVLLDLQLPGLNGFETARRIRAEARSRHTPIIFVTAGDSPEFPVPAAYELGAVDYLVKPLVPAILRAKVAVFVDLTRQAARIRDLERDRAGEALRASEDRFRLIVESATDYAIFTTDLDGRIQTWSAGAANVFGYPAAEAVGRDVDLLFTPEDVTAGASRREMAAALAAGRGEDERRHVRKGGEQFWASGLLFPLRDGTVRGFLKILRDRTSAQEDARRKDEFLATIAHELRSPLAPIRNGIQVLGMSPDEGTRAQVCGVLERQVEHLSRLIDDLLDVARVGQDKLRLRIEAVDLRLVAEAAGEAARPVLDAAGHRFTVHLPAEPVRLTADPARLAQVVSNLLTNAAKYTPPRGEVRLAVETEGGAAAVRVRDTGVGIPADMLPKVFDLFTQVGTSLDRAQGGLGIGLTLVKGLVEMHGGTVEAKSDGPGAGSEFVVRLPLATG